MTQLPDLSKVLFYLSDVGAHAEDPCCVSLSNGGFIDDVAKWTQLRDEFWYALVNLTGGQQADDPGWMQGHPVAFLAHRVCELTLKRAIAPQIPPIHTLKALLDAERAKNGAAADADVVRFENQMVALLEGKHQIGYPVDKAGRELFADLCCLSRSGLTIAVEAFMKGVDARTPALVTASP